jgi:hypothetical protein
MTFICSWLCLLSAWTINAEPLLFNNNITKFSVMPELCVLSKDAQHCETKLKIEWAASKPTQLCLKVYYELSKKAVSPIHCWSDAVTQAHVSIPASLKHSIVLELVESSKLDNVDARTFFKLYRAKSTNLRKRNPWDFF